MAVYLLFGEPARFWGEFAFYRGRSSYRFIHMLLSGRFASYVRVSRHSRAYDKNKSLMGVWSGRWEPVRMVWMVQIYSYGWGGSQIIC